MFVFILESIGTSELLLLTFFVIVCLVIYLLIKPNKSHLEKCLFWAELIEPEAIVSRFCGRDLTRQVK